MRFQINTKCNPKIIETFDIPMLTFLYKILKLHHEFTMFIVAYDRVKYLKNLNISCEKLFLTRSLATVNIENSRCQPESILKFKNVKKLIACRYIEDLKRQLKISSFIIDLASCPDPF